MEFRTLLRQRRMTRRYEPGHSVPDEVLNRLLEAGLRAPSAGFSQGWDFVVLTREEDRERFWTASATLPSERPVETAVGQRRQRWLAGMRQAPVLILCLSDPQRYLDRYAEPDKGWAERDPAQWPVPYWDTDVAMAALLMQLSAIDDGWGTCFFGVPAERTDDVRAAFDIPPERRIVGVVSVGAAAPGPGSPSLHRGRRTLAEVAHDGRFARAWTVGRSEG